MTLCLFAFAKFFLLPWSTPGSTHAAPHHRLRHRACSAAHADVHPTRAQTAHDPAYLVKHLLAGLPDVTTRVHQMRQSRTTSGSNTAADKWLEMEASKEAYVKARRLPPPLGVSWPVPSAPASDCTGRSMLFRAGGCSWVWWRDAGAPCHGAP